MDGERDGGKITRDGNGARTNTSISITVGRQNEKLKKKKKKKAEHQVEAGSHMGMSESSRAEVGIAY